MGDDDTVYFANNVVSVLASCDHNEMYYIGGSSESVEQDVMHSYNTSFGGGGFAISYPLAAQLVKLMDGCLDRYYRSTALMKGFGLVLVRLVFLLLYNVAFIRYVSLIC